MDYCDTPFHFDIAQIVEFTGMDVGILKGMGDDVEIDRLGAEFGVESDMLIVIASPLYPSIVSLLVCWYVGGCRRRWGRRQNPFCRCRQQPTLFSQQSSSNSNSIGFRDF